VDRKILLQERADLVAEGRTLFEAADKAGRDLSAEEKTRDDEINARLGDLATDLEREERRRERERAVALTVAGSEDARGRLATVHDRGEDEPWGTRTGAAFGEFLQAIHRAKTGGGMDPRLMAAAQGSGELIGADGGFLVGMDMAAGILRKMHDLGRILSEVQRIPISGNSNGIEINAIKEVSRATGSRWGGVQGYWVDEGTAPSATRPKFRKVQLKLKKIAALGYATDELLADAVALDAVFTQAFAEELTFLTEDAIIEGTGAGQPLGILNAGCKVSVAKETGQAAATIVTTNLSKMWARLPASSKPNAAWFINVDCEPQLDELTIPAGTAAVEPRFVTYGPDGILRIKGRPVIPVEYASTVGTLGDIILADFSQYALIEKGGVQQASSIHVAFTTDETAFRAIYRVDGQPTWESALTPFKGSNTLSPFITLDTRA